MKIDLTAKNKLKLNPSCESFSILASSNLTTTGILSAIDQHADLGYALLNSGAVPAQRVGGSHAKSSTWKVTSTENAETSTSKLPVPKLKSALT